jgi:hypothetical protein
VDPKTCTYFSGFSVILEGGKSLDLNVLTLGHLRSLEIPPNYSKTRLIDAVKHVVKTHSWHTGNKSSTDCPTGSSDNQSPYLGDKSERWCGS